MPVLTVKAQGWERPALVMDSHAIVAEVYTTTGRENQQQTAALFAAAPELLEALYVAKRALAEAMQPHLVPGLRNEYDIVAAAINKATGA